MICQAPGSDASVVVLVAHLADLASAFFFAAQRWRIRSAAAFLWAGVNVRPFRFGAAGVAAAVASATGFDGFLGGRPRRLVGP